MEYGVSNGSGFRLGGVSGDAGAGAFVEQGRSAERVLKAGEVLNDMEQEDRVYDDKYTSGSGLRWLKDGINKLRGELGDNPGGWEERLSDLKEEFKSQGRSFHSRELSLNFTRAAEDMLRDASDRFSDESRQAKARLVNENFKWALADAENDGDFMRAGALVAGSSLPEGQKLSMIRGFKVKERDQKFFGMLGDPLGAIRELESGEFGKGLDERVRMSYMGTATGALHRSQAQKAELLSVEMYANGGYASDDQLKGWVRDRSISYKDAVSYQVARDKHLNDPDAFDPIQFDVVRSAVCAYNPVKDAGRVVQADLLSRVAGLNAPSELKDELKGLLNERLNPADGWEVALAENLVDSDFKAGVLVKFPKDEFDEVIPATAGGDALRVYQKGLQLKYQLSDMVRREVRRMKQEGMAVSPEVLRRVYSELRTKTVLDGQGDASLDLLLNPKVDVGGGLSVPGRFVVPDGVSVGKPAGPNAGALSEEKEVSSSVPVDVGVTEDSFYGVRKADVENLDDMQALSVLLQEAMRRNAPQKGWVNFVIESNKWVREVLRRKI